MVEKGKMQSLIFSVSEMPIIVTGRELDCESAAGNLGGAMHLTLCGFKNYCIICSFPHHSHWLGIYSDDIQAQVRAGEASVSKSRPSAVQGVQKHGLILNYKW